MVSLHYAHLVSEGMHALLLSEAYVSSGASWLKLSIMADHFAI